MVPARERALAAGCQPGTKPERSSASRVPFLALRWDGNRASSLRARLDDVVGFMIPYIKEPNSEQTARLRRTRLRTSTADLDGGIAWTRLLTYRRHGRSRGKLLADPVCVLSYWLPKFLDARYGIKLSGLAAPLIVSSDRDVDPLVAAGSRAH